MYRNPASDLAYIYGFKMVLFKNSKSGEFLLFQWNFQMEIDAQGTIIEDEKKSSTYVVMWGSLT